MRIVYLLIGIVFSCQVSFGQSDTRNLVFEGAGIRGLAYAGALEVLEEKNIISGIQNVGGTSAGAITALMISLGYTSAEVKKIISETDFGDFNEGEYFFFGGFHRVKNNFGWYKTDKFELWLEKIIEDKTGDKNTTFEEMQKHGFLNLYVTATCLNQQKILVFSNESYPRMRIKDAVKISMSVPLYFEAVFIDSLGRIHEKPEDYTGLDIVLDGGVIGNFPIDIFDKDSLTPEGKAIRIPNSRTIGFRIDSYQQIENDQKNQALTPVEINNMQDYLVAMYVLIIENLNRNQLEDFDWQRTISISDAGIGPKVKSLSKEQKADLIASGRQGVLDYFSKKGD